MSVERYLMILRTARVHEGERGWFGKWLRGYAVFLEQSETSTLVVSVDSVKQFCRRLLGRQVPAWQRLQAVRAIEFYRSEMLLSAAPDLLEIRQVLARPAEAERMSRSAADSEFDFVGVIPPDEPQWIQKMTRTNVRRHETTERGHGLDEKRTYFICPVPDDLLSGKHFATIEE